MSIKRPFLKFEIDEIESLFKRNRNNRSLIGHIEDELKHRHTKKSKLFMQKIQNLQPLVAANKTESQIILKDMGIANNVDSEADVGNIGMDESFQDDTNQNLEIFLKGITLKNFVKNNPVPVRVENSILAEDDDFIGFDSIYSFITASEKNKKQLTRLPFFGQKSLNDLVSSIENFIEGLDEGVLNSKNEDLYLEQSIESSTFNIPVDKALEASLNAAQASALRGISLHFFVNSCNKINVRTRNAILEADGLYEFQNLYDFYIAPDKYKKNLLRLDNFGKNSLDNLIQSVKFIITENGLLVSLSDFATKTSDINVFETIDKLVEYAILNILNDKEELIIRERYLNEFVSTLQEVADRLDVTRERVRQIEEKAIRKIKGFIFNFPEKNFRLRFQNEFETCFFENCNFISIKRASNVTKKMPKSIALCVRAFNGSLDAFLNEWFFYSVKLQGWFIGEDLKNKNEKNFTLKKSLDMEVAIQNAQWPIAISNLSDGMDLPECVVTDMIISSSKFYIENLKNGDFVRPVKVTVKNAVRYVLRRYKRGMSLEEVKDNCFEMFNLDLSLRAIGAALAELPDGLIVNTGTYALYESLNINESQINSIREFCKKYLIKEQKYISAFVIFNELKKQDHVYEKYGDVDNGHIFFGVCQDGESFITRKGFMIGLNSFNFKGEYMSLTREIVNLMKIEQRPLRVREIIDKLSATRYLTHSSMQGVFESGNSGVFEKIGNSYFLVGNRSHLEIDDTDFFEVEFDEI